MSSAFPFKYRRLVSLHLNQCDHTHCQSGIRGRTVPVTGTGKELKNWPHKECEKLYLWEFFLFGGVVSAWVWNCVKLHDILVCLVVTWYHDIIFRDMYYWNLLETYPRMHPMIREPWSCEENKTVRGWGCRQTAKHEPCDGPMKTQTAHQKRAIKSHWFDWIRL